MEINKMKDKQVRNLNELIKHKNPKSRKKSNQVTHEPMSLSDRENNNEENIEVKVTRKSVPYLTSES